jgi:isoamylase
MPQHPQVFEFNELEYYSPIPGSPTGEHRFNFWGYSTVNFFSPMARYSFAIASGADGAALQQEFKLLVREAHKRGIEVRRNLETMVDGLIAQI